MPRTPRKKSPTGIYHVMLRGINRDILFFDDQDYQRFIAILTRAKEVSDFNLYGYCLMNNHVHLLLKERTEDISSIMKRVGVGYASWFNWKYKREGPVFQGRFKSECVDSESYLLTVIRYIHQNPIKAGIVKKCELYKWSSCLGYYEKSKNSKGLIDTDEILSLFGKEITSIKKFKDFMEYETDEECLEYESKTKLNDEEVSQYIVKIIGVKDMNVIQCMDANERNQSIITLLRDTGASIRQIARITGLNYNVVQKAASQSREPSP
jgi:REP element-mobilizing transposase RayT